MPSVFVVCEVGVENHRIAGVFSTPEAAEAERLYCHHTARAIELYPEDYVIEEYVLDEPLAAILCRVRDGGLTMVRPMPGDSHFDACRPAGAAKGVPQWYDRPWPDGTFAAVWARSVAEGVERIEEALDAGVSRPVLFSRWPAFGQRRRGLVVV